MIDLNEVRAELDSLPQGGSTVDPTAPSKGPGDKDPNEPAFTVRVVVTDTAGNRAEDRKMLFAYRDATLHQGYAKDLGTGGEASPRLFDLNGDNALDTVLADSSGELRVLNHDGQPLPTFNNGQPVRSRLYPNVHLGSESYNDVDPPREVLRTPAIGDIDGDLEPEIVDSAGEHVYAWEADGSTVAGFPVRIDPALSRPQDRNRNNHIKRGFSASPTLGDLNDDGDLEIVIPSLDQHVYAWDGSGNPLPGFPKKLQSSGIPGAEIITTAALGDVTGDGKIDIVTPTQEFDDNPSAPADPRRRRGGRLLQHPHEHPRERARRQRARVRARPQRQHPARLADRAERDRPRRAAVRRARAWTTSSRTSTATPSSRRSATSPAAT